MSRILTTFLVAISVAFVIWVVIVWARPRHITIYTYNGDRIQFKAANLARRSDDSRYSFVDSSFTLHAAGGILAVPINFEGIEAFDVIHNEPTIEHEYAKLRLHYNTGRVVVGLYELCPIPQPVPPPKPSQCRDNDDLCKRVEALQARHEAERSHTPPPLPVKWDIIEGQTAEGYEQIDLCRVDRMRRE